MIKQIRKAVLSSIIALMAVAATGCGTTFISPGYVGIVVNSYGSDKGVSDFPVTTGRVWYNPFTTSVMEYPTFIQNVVWEKTEELNEEITFTNKDKFPIALDVNLQYQLDPAKIPAFYVTYRHDDLTRFSDGPLHSLARDEFNRVAGRYGIDEIMGDSSKFLDEVRSGLQAKLDGLGVKVTQFGVVHSPRPPKEVIDSITASASASQNAIRIQNELASTNAEVMKQVAAAKGAAEARLTQAEAEAEANRKIAASISPTLVDYMRANRWDGKLPQVTGSGGTLIDLTK